MRKFFNFITGYCTEDWKNEYRRYKRNDINLFSLESIYQSIWLNFRKKCIFIWKQLSLSVTCYLESFKRSRQMIFLVETSFYGTDCISLVVTAHFIDLTTHQRVLSRSSRNIDFKNIKKCSLRTSLYFYSII